MGHKSVTRRNLPDSLSDQRLRRARQLNFENERQRFLQEEEEYNQELIAVLNLFGE